MRCHLSDDGEEEESGQVASALVNISPKMPRVECPNAVQPVQSSRPECFDVTLQRKDNEGFGFVILTSKNKPPPGGQKYSKTQLMYKIVLYQIDKKQEGNLRTVYMQYIQEM